MNDYTPSPETSEAKTRLDAARHAVKRAQHEEQIQARAYEKALADDHGIARGDRILVDGNPYYFEKFCSNAGWWKQHPLIVRKIRKDGEPFVSRYFIYEYTKIEPASNPETDQ